MPVSKDQLLKRIDALIETGTDACKDAFPIGRSREGVSPQLAGKFRSGGLSFLKTVFGEQHPFFKEFDKLSGNNKAYVEANIGTLESAKAEIEHGWLLTLRGLIAAEVF